MEVLEGQNILVTISGKKNRVRVYYLSWLKSKILRTDGMGDVSPFDRYVAPIIQSLFHLPTATSRTPQRMDQRGRSAGGGPLQDRQVRTDQVLGHCAQGLDRDLRLGAEALPQVYGI